MITTENINNSLICKPPKLRALLPLAVFSAIICINTGCSVSDSSYNYDDTPLVGSDIYDSDNVHYGTGPGNTKPKPQTKPVDLNGVKGAKITNEKYSRRGNKDYEVLGKQYKVWRDVESYYEEGIASWYGPGFNGQNTSNGEHYNMNGFTAAHKNLPLPSFLKVTNLTNGKSVIVRVNDRGPFHGNRILDLSKGAAQQIGVIGPGTAKVRVELIKTVPSKQQTTMAEMNGFKPYIQVFTTSDYSKALNIKNDIENYVKALSKAPKASVFIQQVSNGYRIKIGKLSPECANEVLQQVKNRGYNSAYFVTE